MNTTNETPVPFTIGRNMRGELVAQTEINLGADSVLEIRTSKTSSGFLVTYASVHKIEGNWKTHRMFGDYSKRLVQAKMRATEKAVAAQHKMAIADIEQIKAEITAFYAMKEAA